MRHPVVILWSIGVAAQIACLCSLFRRNLAWRYPGLVCFLAVQSGRAFYLLHGLQSSPTGYYDRWIETAWVSPLCSAILAGECLRLLVGDIPAGRTTILAWLGGIAGAFAALGTWVMDTGAVGVPLGIDLTRRGLLAAALFVGVCRWWSSGSPLGLRLNVRRVVSTALGVFIATSIATIAYRWTHAANWILAAMPVVSSWLWGGLNQDGERPTATLAASGTRFTRAELTRLADALDPPERSGVISVKLVYAGRSKPLPYEDE